jgi:hypothetical protein
MPPRARKDKDRRQLRESPPPVRKEISKEDERRSPSIATRATALDLNPKKSKGANGGDYERYNPYEDERGQDIAAGAAADDDDMSGKSVAAGDDDDDDASTTHVSKSFRIGVLESRVAAITHAIVRHEELTMKNTIRIEANMTHFNGLREAWAELNSLRPMLLKIDHVIQLSSEKRSILAVLDSDSVKKEVMRVITEKLTGSQERIRVLPYTPPGKGCVTSAPSLITKVFRKYMESRGQVGYFSHFKMNYPNAMDNPDFVMVCENTPILHGRLNTTLHEMQVFITTKATCGQIVFKRREFLPQLEEALKSLKNYPFPLNLDTTQDVLVRPQYFVRDGSSSVKGGKGKGKGKGGRGK